MFSLLFTVLFSSAVHGLFNVLHLEMQAVCPHLGEIKDLVQRLIWI